MKNLILLGLVNLWAMIEDVTVDGVLTWRTAVTFLLMLIYTVYESARESAREYAHSRKKEPAPTDI